MPATLARSEIVRQYGEWTSHNIHLGGDNYTFPKDHPKFEQQLVGHGQHLRRILQIAEDTARKPVEQMRVLDLGCLEGLYAIEFALRGAEVVGIEGREPNVAKANFAKETLGLNRLTFTLDDARGLSKEKYGEFDVTLCLGLLYHLDAPDVFEFVEKLAETTRGVCIIDTHVSVKPDKAVPYKGREYRGWAYREHAAGATPEQREAALWSSLKDEFSFWLSRPSLYNLLLDSGFTSAYACYAPVSPGGSADRDTFVAIKGKPARLLSIPAELQDERWDETNALSLNADQQAAIESKTQPPPVSLFRSIARRVLPESIRSRLRG